VTTESRTRDLAADEITTCPVPTKPQPVVVHSSTSDVDCTSHVRTVTTTTTTTDWVLNADKTAWVKGTPVVTTAVETFDTTAAECPVTPTPTPSPTVGGVKHTAPPTVTPTVEGVKHSAAAPALAYTGTEAGSYGAIGLLLLVAGSGLVLVTRKRGARG
jgi:LPXTG-motif cell wall-anchored protein